MKNWICHTTAFVALMLGITPITSHALKSDATQPINIRSQNIEANEKTGLTVYRGNVVLTQGSLQLTADRLEVTTREGRAQVMRASGNPARVRSRTDKGEELQAQAQHIEYRAQERRLDLHERVRLQRDGDQLTGSSVRYLLDSENFSAEGGKDGQVNAVIQPATQEPRP